MGHEPSRIHPLLGLICPIVVLALLTACDEPREPASIESAETNAPPLLGSPAEPQPIEGALPPAHPHMADPGTGYMHVGTYNSDVHPQSGPLGRAPEVISRDGSRQPGGMCPIHTITDSEKLVVLCAGLFNFELQLLEPDSLELLDSYELPPRPSTFHALFTLEPDHIMSDTSGAYFYLDRRDRVVIADAEQHIQRIAVRRGGAGEWGFERIDDWDLSGHLPHDCWGWLNWFPDGDCDPITAVMPDHEGRLWWVSRYGRIGVLAPESGDLAVTRLEGEQIQNGFAVDDNGVYIVSDHAMYGFTASASGQPRQLWRQPYDRGSQRKVGSINQGSGTTPTLLGERYVAITDNADERINLLVYRRRPAVTGERLVCRMPLFQRGASATDNTMVGLGRAIVIENNHGYTSAFEQSDWDAVTGGIWRIDVRPDGSGCDVMWRSREKAPSVVPKLSAVNGLLYFYTFRPQGNGENAWYLMALDFATGETRFKIRTGAGSGYDNNWSSITLAPDGTAYIGTFKGLVAIRDTR